MPHDNRDHYYLSDAMGVSVGLCVDDDGNLASDRRGVPAGVSA
jgi:hypothetical protein